MKTKHVRNHTQRPRNRTEPFLNLIMQHLTHKALCITCPDTTARRIQELTALSDDATASDAPDQPVGQKRRVLASKLSDWIDLAQDKYRWWAVVNEVMNLPVP